MRPGGGHSFSGSHVAPHVAAPHPVSHPYVAPHVVPHTYVPVPMYHPPIVVFHHRASNPVSGSSYAGESADAYQEPVAVESHWGWPFWVALFGIVGFMLWKAGK